MGECQEYLELREMTSVENGTNYEQGPSWYIWYWYSKKFILSQWRKLPAFMEPEDSWQYSQQSTSGSYPQL